MTAMNSRSIAAALALAVLAAIPAHANDGDDPLVTANAYNLALSYACRHTFGMDAYEATRAETAAALEPIIGYPQAIVFVNDLDEKFRNDPRLTGRPAALACHKMKAESMRQIRIERARLAD